MIKNIGNKGEACRQIQLKYDIPGSVQLLVKKYNRYISAGKRFHKKLLFTAYEEILFCLLLELFLLISVRWTLIKNAHSKLLYKK